MSYCPSLSTVNLKTLDQSLYISQLIASYSSAQPGQCQVLEWVNDNASFHQQHVLCSLSENTVVFRELLPKLRALTSLTINVIIETESLYTMGFDSVPPVYMA